MVTVCCCCALMHANTSTSEWFSSKVHTASFHIQVQTRLIPMQRKCCTLPQCINVLPFQQQQIPRLLYPIRLDNQTSPLCNVFIYYVICLDYVVIDNRSSFTLHNAPRAAHYMTMYDTEMYFLNAITNHLPKYYF